ncbi:aldehyde dehydrogenase family protein [Rhizohabitans arisaemae]|uniref:aldehyde dehydrogenase family protein n=1 Tax=Rhizohabitans arisaemae TaxID=2720610 RepID=UPI0024B06A3C|nr:aldehyde dehydrogenase family protein [Rhizohabitans arisaemae]
MRQNYIDGAWTPAISTRSAGERTSDDGPPAAEAIDVLNPATEEILDRVPAGSPDDVDLAVAAARAAFPAWAETAPAARAAVLSRAAALIRERAEEIARIVVADLGAPLGVALKVHTLMPAAVLDSYASLAQTFPFDTGRVGNSLVVREPVGVVGAITPWNYPLHQVVAKVAPALAAGCTVVVKPSEVAPLAAYEFAAILAEAGLPPGVFNLVGGTGPVVGEAIAAHPDVDAVSFTGSVRAGRRVAALAATTVKRVTLELGGKSANLILPDADLPRAVKVGVAKAFLNSGQTCSAWTRMLVPESSYPEAVALAAEAAAGYTVGDPLAADTRLGPLVSAAQRERVLGYLHRGVEEGARVVAGGTEVPAGRGFYVRPTVLADVRPGMVVEQEEIFGPVLSVLSYATEDEAVAIANGTPYGLAGGVWSASQERAVAVARRLRTGQVDINGGAWNILAPFGGYKQSGVGRELGVHGLEEYLEVKSLQL